MSPHPDAELIDLCDHYADLDRQLQYINNVLYRDDDAASDAASDVVAAAQRLILDRICAVHVTTMDGLLARLRALGTYRRDADLDDCPDDRLLAALLRDAAPFQAAILAPAAVDPDAALIADCAAFDALERQVIAVHGEEPEHDTERDRLAELQDIILDRIMTTTATTHAGHVALARSVVEWKPELVAPGTGDTGERLLHVLLTGLVGADYVAARLERMQAENIEI